MESLPGEVTTPPTRGDRQVSAKGLAIEARGTVSEVLAGF